MTVVYSSMRKWQLALNNVSDSVRFLLHVNKTKRVLLRFSGFLFLLTYYELVCWLSRRFSVTGSNRLAGSRFVLSDAVKGSRRSLA